MGLSLIILILRICVIVSSFQVHGYAAPAIYGSRRSIVSTNVPSFLDTRARTKYEASSPERSFYKHRHHHDQLPLHHDQLHHTRNHIERPAAGPSNLHHRLPDAAQFTRPAYAVSPIQAPISSRSERSPILAPSPSVITMPIHPPAMSPSSTSTGLAQPPTTGLALPPPPPNQDCTALSCTEPLTYTLSGVPCGCVRPIQVKLQLTVALYSFFPLVSELASEIASSLALNQSQVRIMGANADILEPEKSIVLVDLVPLEAKFNHSDAFSVYEKFWRKKVHVNSSLFGAYDVLEVHYQGLPPSPPSVSSNLASIDNPAYPRNNKDKGGSSVKPLGVDIPRRQRNGFGGRVAAVIIMSCVTAFVACVAIVLIVIMKCKCSERQPKEGLHTAASSFTKPSGATRSLALGSRSLSESLSFSSGMLNFTGSAKVYSLHDMERATNGFDSTRVLGEGGFGVVYRGVFYDGEQVAVKVLKRDNRHGVREFLSEVEMLSRLHHRNLVKLIGICTEDHIRCLLYELVPNGSVDSHLHGADKEAAPLGWPIRMKIALGAARALAYLHEDSSPCVIHRDFKSSNILLEDDFTPKVSDFGLATNALNGGNEPIATQVIGTFGYLAPEYAMTGHLLVKSDVYSYGVVLLELLTGRKPVDFSKPPGQENLVAWAHPQLTSKEGLEMIMDPTLRPIISFDSFSKVAAIASMCVQPEVSRRPFMGEVVQALKLICSELDTANDEGHISTSFDQEKVSVGEDIKNEKFLCEYQDILGAHYSVTGHESSSDNKTALSAVNIRSASARFEEVDYESVRRQYSSGPLRSGGPRSFWQRLGRFSRGSMREHLWPGFQ